MCVFFFFFLVKMSHGRLPGTSDVMMSFLKLHSHFRDVHNKILQAGSNYNKVSWTLVLLILLLLTRKALLILKYLTSQNRFIIFFK